MASTVFRVSVCGDDPCHPTFRKKIATDGRPVTGTITRTEEKIQVEPGSKLNSRYRLLYVWVRFTDPTTGTEIEKPFFIRKPSETDLQNPAYQPGTITQGHYVPGSPFFLIGETLPDPAQNVNSLLVASAFAFGIAGILGWLLRRS